MRNKNIGYKARMLISELIVEPCVAKYMVQLKSSRNEVFVHSLNVAYLAAETFYNDALLLQGKSKPKKYIRDVVCGALLHDIGKLKIPNNILLKQGKLSEEEYEKVKKHPVYGYEMIKNDPNFSDLTKEIVLSHHEKTNGTGYPNHQMLAELDPGVQLVAICDIYDALTEKRAYREQASIFNAFSILLGENLDNEFFLLLASCSDL